MTYTWENPVLNLISCGTGVTSGTVAESEAFELPS